MTGKSRSFRALIALALAFAGVLLLSQVVNLADRLLAFQQRLDEGPALVMWGFWLAAFVVVSATAWGISRVLRPRRRRPPPAPAPAANAAGMEARLEQGRQLGVDVSDAERELRELARRREAGRVYIALVGDVSTGKSTLVHALVPGAEPATSVTAGTTTDITHYEFALPSGDTLVLTDVPGLREAGADESPAAIEEALRSHVVVYLSDTDLTRDAWEDLMALAAVGKPLILALNKADRFDEAALEQLTNRLHQRLDELGMEPGSLAAVAVSAGGEEEVVRVEPDGSEAVEARPREARVEPLRVAIQRMLDRSADALEDLRDSSVFALVGQRLDEATARRRAELAEQEVAGYTRKAVVGALAAVSPGTDILIQGYLGTSMVKALCKVYDVPAGDMDVNRFLDLCQQYVGRTLPIVLAIAGNGLKAFPGVGTVAGGLTHAVAYGLIFDALGTGLANTLAAGGGLRPAAAARSFRENLGEDLREKTVRVARLALASKDDEKDARD